MHPTPPDRNELDQLAEDFVERHRRGEEPSIDDFAERHPFWADEIRKLFPTLWVMERAGEPTESIGDADHPAPRSRSTIWSTMPLSLPPIARIGAWRNGRRLRGRARIARTSGGIEVAALSLSPRLNTTLDSSARQGRPPSCITRTSCRSSILA